ncbi:MAG: glycosyltransferase [Pseudomonadota bacterium]
MSQEASQRPRISAVVCCKNEAARIEACLIALKTATPDEVIVVDGASSDETVNIAKLYTDKIIVSDAGDLTSDRQIGIDAAEHDFIAMIDADHRVKPGDLERLYEDLEHFGFDIVQAGVCIEPTSFWACAENDAFSVFQQQPGPRKNMIGASPALYRRKVFDKVRYDREETGLNDDAGFYYRLSQHKDVAFGVGYTKIDQAHFGEADSYAKKFAWYGRMDASFCVDHPERAHSMFFHLTVRYMLWRPAKALFSGKLRAIPYFWFCGGVRFWTLLKTLPKLLKDKRMAGSVVHG